MGGKLKGGRMEGREVVTKKPMSLGDIADFFRYQWRRILSGCVAGGILAAAWLVVTPYKYEAKWQFQIAQIAKDGGSAAGLNVEEPAVLVQRLRSLSAYTEQVRKVCISGEDELGDYLGGVFEAQIIKNVTTVVDMRVRSNSVSQVRQCAEALVSMMVAQENELLDERLAGRREQLALYQDSLLKEQLQLERIKTSELGNFGYLAKSDRLSWLRSRIDALQEEALLSKMHPAKLLAPIYISNNPVWPKKGFVLILGVLMGLMFGVLYALLRGTMRQIEQN